MQGGYKPVSREVTATDLRVTGKLPAALDGLYVRNSSNPAHGETTDWFLGDGMLHGLRLSDGRAQWYRNRWVRTALYQARADVLNGVSKGLVPGGAVNPSNTSLVWHGNKLPSLCEVGYPFEISTTDLSTTGPYDFNGRLTTAMTAHPKLDPATGNLHFFGYGFAEPFLTYHVAAPDGTLISSEEVVIPRCTMMHDFAITDRDVIFWDMPVVFDTTLALMGRMPFQWDPAAGSRIGIMPLGGPASAIRWVDIPTGFVFHGTNAFRDGDNVVVDVGHLPTFYAKGGDAPSKLTVRRWTINVSRPSMRFSEQILTDRQIDLPTIDRRVTGRPYRYAFYVEAASQPGGVINWGGLVRRDAVTGAEVTYDPGPGRSAAEGLFVADGAAEGHGWVLTFVYDWSTRSSVLAVLAAEDLASGPVATVALPQRVPFGFHGTWVPDAGTPTAALVT
jgi:carotenoid cleavage dioxygenase